jgi:hypothetical protein
MKKLLSIAAVCLALSAAPSLYAHHAAEGIVDEEVWEMIDALVADTPHTDMELDVDATTGMWEMDITARTVRSMEKMIGDGLMTYLEMMDTTTISIEFNADNSVTMSISGN